ncbi:hypothetical protein ZHAS_00007203 [Anopheles sinensis]|uniref:Uncharacterized protein n=1 Tax=Anopheles sinensis TaxID=74873 RepID=A0A084VPD9_ANOSI|nr:hypothetical protein ZHAS_00007203 [Anopheles sinensis]
MGHPLLLVVSNHGIVRRNPQPAPGTESTSRHRQRSPNITLVDAPECECWMQLHLPRRPTDRLSASRLRTAVVTGPGDAWGHSWGESVCRFAAEIRKRTEPSKAWRLPWARRWHGMAIVQLAKGSVSSLSAAYLLAGQSSDTGKGRGKLRGRRMVRQKAYAYALAFSDLITEPFRGKRAQGKRSPENIPKM